ncbi:MAG: hypothetical protein NT126_05495 [Bacteroidetes bacterium]|nr:hypothetical protein [Bacteroidota bacterium]
MKKIIMGFSLILLSAASFAQHVLFLKTGEKMNGKVQSLKDGVISFEFKGNIMKLNVAEVASISFSEATPAPKAAAEPGKTEPVRRETGEKQIVSGSYLVKYKVADRTIVRTPQVSNLTQEKGTVVVDISIDKYGHIMKAVPGAGGSTTSSEYLLTKRNRQPKAPCLIMYPLLRWNRRGT